MDRRGHPLTRWFRRAPTISPGARAEQTARRHLEKKGFRFLAANHRTRFGEVDLVMEEGATVVFVEVKARSRTDFGRPEEFVTRAKQARVAKAALDFVKVRGLADRPLRFDVVGLSGEEIAHLPNAFVPDAGRYLF